MKNRRLAAASKGMVGTVVGCTLLLAIVWMSSRRSDDVIQSDFSLAVDLSTLSNIAVQHNGRLKSFDSYARTMTKFVTGPRLINGPPSEFTSLDMMFRPDAYDKAEIIYVKHKDMRKRIAQQLAGDPAIPAERLTRFNKVGLISPEWLARPEVVDLLNEMSRDLIRTAKFVNAVRDATFVRLPGTLAGSLRIMPPPGEDRQQAWLPVDSLWQTARAPQDAAHADMRRRVTIPDLDPKLQDSVASGWLGLAAAWQRQDAPAVNRALAGLADDLAKLNPHLYPAAEKLQLESWYVRYKAMVWIWMIYLLAVVPLLMSVIYHWLWARRVGLVFFLAAFGLHTTSIGIRWYLSGRIPNSNMFEAIIAATWFGAVAALIMEFLVRKSGMRNLFVLGSAVCAMVAMMCSHFMPVALTSDINHIMPVLNDVWLYIHTNVIIFSYCLIGMATITALLYLGYRIFGGNDEYARSGGAGQIILAGAAAKPFVKAKSPGYGQVLDGATMVLMELSFVLLWTGLCMGAIWADHSWGRPWGWDPKEVFALNTFLVFLLLVHVRLKVRDKALWTAVLACVGCGVMLFNWIVVNFVITGLHSYA